MVTHYVGGGIPAAYRRVNLRWVVIFLIAALLSAVILLPAGYVIWWLNGGQQIHKMSQMRKLAASNPVQDAMEATKYDDFRLVKIVRNLESVTPGGYFVNEPHILEHGGIALELFEGNTLSKEQKTLNNSAMNYATQYNQQVMREIDRRKKAGNPPF